MTAMNEQDFENLLSMAKSNNIDSVRLAREIAENSDLPIQDKKTIICQSIISELQIEPLVILTKTIYPFK